MGTTTVEEQVDILFKANMSQLKKDMNAVKKTAKGTAASIGASIKTALTGLGVGIIAKEFIAIADTMSLVNDRISLVSDSTEELVTAQRELFLVAQDTRQTYEATAGLYTKLAQATESMTVSQQDLFDVTKAVNQALVISGADAAETASVIKQLGQGLASGVLRGDEFNSIMENGSRVSKALSDSLGVTIGELREMAQAGKLTSDIVFDALKGQADVLSAEFKGMSVTVDQAMTVAQNSFYSLVDGFNQSINGSGGVASIIMDAAEYMDTYKDSIVDMAEDIVAVATIVKNGLQSILLVSLQGYLALTVAFKKQIESVLNAIVKGVETSLNYVIKAINDATDFWGVDLGKLTEVDLGEVKIDTAMAENAISGIDMKLKDLSKSTANGLKELVTDDVVYKVKEITTASKATKEAVAGVAKEATKAGGATKKLKEDMKGVKEETDDTITAMEELGESVTNTVGSAMTNVFRSWMDGAMDFKDMMGNMLKDIAAQMFEILVVKQLISGITGSFSGGVSGVTSALGAFAEGGTAYKSGSYLVGEQGAEMVNLSAGSTVTPNHELGGVTVNVNNYSNSDVDVRQSGNDIDIIISTIANGITRGTSAVSSAIENRYALQKQ